MIRKRIDFLKPFDEDGNYIYGFGRMVTEVLQKLPPGHYVYEDPSDGDVEVDVDEPVYLELI